MFCQTEVIYDHQFYQLYLWRDCNAAITPKVFAMQRLMFGITSRPFLAIQCVLHHGQKDRIVAKYGDSSYNLLRDNMYMDDVHLGGEWRYSRRCGQKAANASRVVSVWSLEFGEVCHK